MLVHLVLVPAGSQQHPFAWHVCWLAPSYWGQQSTRELSGIWEHCGAWLIVCPVSWTSGPPVTVLGKSVFVFLKEKAEFKGNYVCVLCLRWTHVKSSTKLSLTLQVGHALRCSHFEDWMGKQLFWNALIFKRYNNTMLNPLFHWLITK